MTSNYARRNFVERAAPAAIEFATAFKLARSSSTKQQLVLTEFVAANRTFFMAPDLLDVLDVAEPWNASPKHGEAAMVAPEPGRLARQQAAV